MSRDVMFFSSQAVLMNLVEFYEAAIDHVLERAKHTDMLRRLFVPSNRPAR